MTFYLFLKINRYYDFFPPYIALNTAYNKCQWKVEIFSKTAVSDQKGATTFFSDHDAKNLEWGGTIIGNLQSKLVNKQLTSGVTESQLVQLLRN